jgi:hypothetical protein
MRGECAQRDPRPLQRRGRRCRSTLHAPARRPARTGASHPRPTHYAALGSGQRAKVKKRFQRSAKREYDLRLEAIEAEGKFTINKKWKAVFGKPVPGFERSRSLT